MCWEKMNIVGKNLIFGQPIARIMSKLNTFTLGHINKVSSYLFYDAIINIVLKHLWKYHAYIRCEFHAASSI